MRMQEEICCKIDEERTENEIVSFHQPQKKLVVVGYALTSKKTKSFLQPKLEGLARNKGISFVAIDPHRPLSDQGPFDIVLQKLTGKEWRQILEDYRGTHPEVTVLDPPDAIQHLHNRQSMLQCVADMNLSNAYGKVGVPRQLVIEKDASSIPEVVNNAGLTLPLVAKPLVNDGSAKSHELSLAYDQYSLKKLEPPLVLQEFVNHGGVLFKVYIVGEAIKVVRRFSLPDVTKQELSKSAGVFRFPRVSCAAASADDADLDPSVGGDFLQGPIKHTLFKSLQSFLHDLYLRDLQRNFVDDWVCGCSIWILSENTAPEIIFMSLILTISQARLGKMPEYEHIFTDFLLSLVQSQCKKKPC
ncbi:hypothetical protein EZV62_021759 [Acer yangbiense]|uniref:Inositol-tetrakisphosphate 1-kinase n=1 Tax=Acer yangbiense TaxID=1000413 RepID=A0A5C7H6J0_9ROSI|nr:hypothetical protein EZV62_021759 [Acer yangbiense]